ncbi:CocE/NonD family hydrolase [Gluconacetobacter sacchari]|uniref:CocE/NonD family hydrolase n=1 Tax=Gluconacetobacter sacchari TaxID=92759 RepID=UPI0039B4DE17
MSIFSDGRMYRRLLVAVAVVFGTGARAAEPARSLHVDQNVMVRVHDGIDLATDIYTPGDASRSYPVLMHRTPYDKSAPNTVAIARALAGHGYIVVVQDMRGRHHSQGVFEKYDTADAQDGYDAVEWAARLPRSDGQVGMYGTSYAAHTQADTAKLHPPHLRALVLNMGGMADAWDHSVRNDGAFELGRQLSWAWEQIIADTKDPVVRARLQHEKLEDWYTALPLRPGLNPLSGAPNYEKYYQDESTLANDGPYWKRLSMNWADYYGQTADVPMLHLGGWYDIYLRGTIRNWRSLRRIKKADQRLLIGPWTHHGDARRYAGDVDFGDEAAIADFDVGFHLRWFDHYLKHLDNGVESDAPVRYFLMGGGDGHRTPLGRMQNGGVWKNATDWPPPEARAMTLFLAADGQLSDRAPADGVDRYLFDPAHPVPSIGGSVSARLKDGAYDQRERPDMVGSRPPYLPLSARSDVVVYQTAPLDHDVTIAGPIKVRLFVSSTGRDTDFTAKLVDAYPPSADYPGGFAMNLADGVRRMRYRNGLRTAKLIQPGKIYEIEVDPFDIANVFRKGHRIELDVSSSNFPRFDVNPNTGEPLGRNRRAVVVENSLYHDAGHASALSLWMIPQP